VYYNYNCYTLHSSTFAFHKVVQRHHSGKLGDFTISDVKFPQDIGHQKLLKSIKFLQSYSKYKRGRF